jgi:hypothetical protein
MANVGQARYDREIKTCSPPKGTEVFQDPKVRKRLSCSILSIAPKSMESIPAYPLVMWQRNWKGVNAKQPHEQGRYEKDGKDVAAV